MRWVSQIARARDSSQGSLLLCGSRLVRESGWIAANFVPAKSVQGEAADGDANRICAVIVESGSAAKLWDELEALIECCVEQANEACGADIGLAPAGAEEGATTAEERPCAEGCEVHPEVRSLDYTIDLEGGPVGASEKDDRKAEEDPDSQTGTEDPALVPAVRERAVGRMVRSGVLFR